MTDYSFLSLLYNLITLILYGHSLIAEKLCFSRYVQQYQCESQFEAYIEGISNNTLSFDIDIYCKCAFKTEKYMVLC